MSLLKINSFHSKICPSVLLSKIDSFLFGVWPSVLLKYQFLPFLGYARLYFAKYQLLPFWLRLCAAPLYLCAIITCSICHSLGPGCTRPKGAGIYPAIALIGSFVLCWRKGEKQVPQWLGHNECASYLDRGDPDHFCLIGPGCTRPYTNNYQSIMARNITAKSPKLKNTQHIPKAQKTYKNTWFKFASPSGFSLLSGGSS